MYPSPYGRRVPAHGWGAPPQVQPCQVRRVGRMPPFNGVRSMPPPPPPLRRCDWNGNSDYCHDELTLNGVDYDDGFVDVSQLSGRRSPDRQWRVTRVGVKPLRTQAQPQLPAQPPPPEPRFTFTHAPYWHPPLPDPPPPPPQAPPPRKPPQMPIFLSPFNDSPDAYNSSSTYYSNYPPAPALPPEPAGYPYYYRY